MTGWERVGLGVVAVLGVALLFAAAMVRPVTYDEDQYVAAGVFARGLLPYRDFVYLQTPLYPLVLGAVFRVVDGWFLLSARLLTFGLSVVSAGLLWGMMRRLGAGVWLAAVLMAACLTSPFLAGPMGNSRNDALPLTLLLGGLGLQLWAGERSWWGRAGAALLVGLAVEAKVSYVFGPVALGVHALFAPGARVGPFVLGSVVAAVPGAWFWWMAPEGFWFGVYGYHVMGPVDWYVREGRGELLTFGARVLAFLDWLLLWGNLTLVVLAGALAVVVRRGAWTWPGGLLVGLLAGALVLGLAPSPAWAMYFAAMAPLLALCVAHLWGAGGLSMAGWRTRVLVGVAAVPILPALVLNAPELVQVLEPARWVGVEAHRNALEVRAALEAAGRSGPVATLFPRAVMDANAVPVTFASGPFVFRSGAAFGAAALGRLQALSAETVGAAFDASPPAGIYAGLYAGAWRAPMDAALSAYAEGRGWRLVREDGAGGRLWVRP